ncbi:MAG TPA: DUF6125 family protein [Myxococcota bacterium]|nr:DUF6125 family protein [Myxococcota bacterium]
MTNSEDGRVESSVEQRKVEDLSQEELGVWVLDAIRRAMVHYGMWYTEVAHQLGAEAANRLEGQAAERGMKIMIERLGKVLGFETKNGMPKALSEMKREKLVELARAVSVNWLVGDGVWFQAVERERDMTTAKLCNDGCWAHFSPYEAYRIKQLLGLSEKPGLMGLAQALQFRLYAWINRQSLRYEEDGSLRMEMNECRVQLARKRKGLDDYPCKSAGLVEYPFFATAIDSRISTECIGCPPDPHPPEWWCAWRFRLTT